MWVASVPPHLVSAETESAIPLLHLTQGSPSMRPQGSAEKDNGADIAVGPIQARFTHSPENPYSDATLAFEDEAVVANQGRLRRLFSFVQLLAFALTFMSSWEVIAM